MRARTGPAPRPGYTLIELLVVMALIAILIGLLLPAVQKTRDSINRTTAVSEISQMDAAVTSFKQTYGFYPPSYMIEETPAGSGNYYVRRFVIPANVNQPEFAILKKMFPRWSPTVNATNGHITAGLPDGHGTILDPNQVMVYFLGGPGSVLGGGAATGWDKLAPVAPTGNTKTTTFYEFPVGRMKNTASTATFDGRYRDPWGTPYAFFTGGSGAIPPAGGENYEAAFMFPWKSAANHNFPAWQSGQQEVVPVLPTASYTLYPTPNSKVPRSPAPSWDDTNATAGAYLAHPVRIMSGFVTGSTTVTTGQWALPGRVQIISAGPNLAFGPGSPYKSIPATGSPQWWDVTFGKGWTNPAATANDLYAGAGPGADDLANFNSGNQLGTGQ